MFASDSVLNLRSRKRPLPPPQQDVAGDAAHARAALAHGSDSLFLPSRNAPAMTSSISNRRQTNPVLPIEKLRAQVENKKKKKNKVVDSSVCSSGGGPVSDNRNLNGSEAPTTAAALSTTAESPAPTTLRLCGSIQGKGLLPAAAPGQRRCTATLPNCQAQRPQGPHPVPQPQRHEHEHISQSAGANKRQRRRLFGCRTVRFELDHNAVHEIAKTPEELSAAWMSRHESDGVRQHILECILAYQVGVIDHERDTLRGLEVHLDPELMRKKAENCRNYTAVILEQQRFLTSIMGHCNEHILSRMSALLSDEDRQMALDAAAADALEASRIHGTPTAAASAAPAQGGGDSVPQRASGEGGGGSAPGDSNPTSSASRLQLDLPPKRSSLSGVREAGCSDNASSLAVDDHRAVHYVLLKAQAT
jgi:hypothetical protein